MLKKTIRKICTQSFFIGLLCSSPLLTYAQSSNSPIDIKISHVDKANSVTGRSALLFKEKLEALFPGQVHVEIFENGSLFRTKEEKEALQLGAVNIIIPSSDTIASNYNVKDFEVFDLPFLFSNTTEVKKFMNSALSQKLLSEVSTPDNNALAIGYLPQGFKNFEATKSITSPQDLNGLMETPITNLTQNVFRNTLNIKTGVTNTIDESTTEKFLATSSNKNFITNSHHLFDTNVMLVNKKWFNSLPINVQQGVIEVAHETSDYAMNNSQDFSKTLKDKHIQSYEWNDNQKEIFKKSVIPVHANFLNNIDKNFLLEVYQVIRQK